ncbi:class I SAM-dependent methyltransferase [Erythrobacter sp.]|uniref:class I SAM-dependent methyltransferase n=1 Tax=Erythrobacter sp. TaxID=1042 RepID=UPI001B177B70|nr:class I SAM-dependent methyltransferase [Erythrobacter sp.]MBO6526364.1 class I SAM-dependent methyltransferase [Erythrobacter sp.]MBO6530617.1 class I SAM-dependent methyltransferase [Erythrobacter sp.]
MTNQFEWTGQVGNVWAAEWQRTDRSFTPVTHRLLEAARSQDFAQALDIGCGAGELAVSLAVEAPSARVIGVDVSDELLAIARERGDALPNLRFELCDAAAWTPGEGERPDLLVSRHGVMFFDDPVAAFAHIAGEAAPGANLIFSCFRERGENAWVRELASALPPGEGPKPDPNAPGPFAFGNRDRVAGILADAGWREIDFEPIDYPMLAGEGPGAVDEALSYFLRIGPAARAVASLEGKQREDALAGLRNVMERNLSDTRVTLPAACWIVTARAPG